LSYNIIYEFMNKYIKILTIISFCLISLFGAQPAAAHETLPIGFQKSTVVSGLAQPTAITLAPDGRIFVIEKGGKVKIVSNDQVVATALSLSVNDDVERGLLGITLDPNFSANGYVYLYYTNANPLENRVSRFTLSGNTLNPASEMILLK